MPIAREKTPAEPTTRKPVGRSNRLAQHLRRSFPELTSEGIDLVINVTQQLVALGDAFVRLQETMEALWSVWKPQIEQDLRAQPPSRRSGVRFNLRSARDSEYDSEASASDGTYMRGMRGMSHACKLSKVLRRMAVRPSPRLSGLRRSQRTSLVLTRRAQPSAAGFKLSAAARG